MEHQVVPGGLGCRAVSPEGAKGGEKERGMESEEKPLLNPSAMQPAHKERFSMAPIFHWCRSREGTGMQKHR